MNSSPTFVVKERDELKICLHGRLLFRGNSKCVCAVSGKSGHFIPQGKLYSDCQRSEKNKNVSNGYGRRSTTLEYSLHV